MDLWSLYWQIFGAGVGISAAYIAIMYFGYKALGKREWEGFVKHEIVQVLVTLFLMPALFIAVGEVFDWVAQDIDPVGHQAVCSGYQLSPGQCYFGLAKNTIGEILREELWLLSQSFMANNLLQIFESAHFTSTGFLNQGSSGFITESLYGGITTTQTIELQKVDEWAYRSFQITAILFAFFKYVEHAFPILLGVGLIARLFPISRRIGGLLIALALATYYILPLPIIVAGDVYHQIPPVEVAKDGQGNSVYMRLAKIKIGGMPSTFGKQWEDTIVNAYLSYGFENTEGMVERSEDMDASAQELEEKRAWWQQIMNVGSYIVDDIAERFKAIIRSLLKLLEFLATLASFTTFNYVSMLSENYFARYYFEVASSFIVISVFSFYVGVIAAIAFVKQFSPMLGGDVEIGGLTHLV